MEGGVIDNKLDNNKTVIDEKCKGCPETIDKMPKIGGYGYKGDSAFLENCVKNCGTTVVY